MPAKKRKKTKISTTLAPRASVSFPPDLYRTLEQIAKEKKVSVAWVVRDAAEQYVAGQSERAKKSLRSNR